MKGQVLLITVLILSTVLLVGLSWGTVSILRIHEAVYFSDSVRALYAADSGIECELFNRFKVPPESAITCSTVPSKMTNGTDYSIVPMAPNRVMAVGNVISSGVRRSIEISY